MHLPQQIPCNIHAAIRTAKWQTRMLLRTRQHNMSTIRQPTHRDLQTALHRQLQPLYTKERNVSRSCTLPNTSQVANPHVATHMSGNSSHFKSKVSPPGILPNTSALQRPHCHCKGICAAKWQTRMLLRARQHNINTTRHIFPFLFLRGLQPQVRQHNWLLLIIFVCANMPRSPTGDHRATAAKKTAKTIPTRTGLTQELPFIASSSHCTRKRDVFSFLYSPQHKLRATSMQPLQGDLHRKVANPHVGTHMAMPASPLPFPLLKRVIKMYQNVKNHFVEVAQ